MEADTRTLAGSGGQHEPAAGLRATVIIVNFEGRGRLGRCLAALLADTTVPFETIVIDNASRDGSWDEAEEHPGVRLVRNESNLGFGRACNQGATLATTPLLVFLNFDCEPARGWLAALVQTAESDASIGAVQGVVLMPDGSVNTAGNLMHFLGFSWAPIGLGADADTPTTPIPVASAACLLVPAAVFERVGGFWEEFFLYCEDTDLSWRIRLAGYQLVTCLVPGPCTTTSSAAIRASTSTSSETASSCSPPITGRARSCASRLPSSPRRWPCSLSPWPVGGVAPSSPLRPRRHVRSLVCAPAGAQSTSFAAWTNAR